MNDATKPGWLRCDRRHVRDVVEDQRRQREARDVAIELDVCARPEDVDLARRIGKRDQAEDRREDIEHGRSALAGQLVAQHAMQDLARRRARHLALRHERDRSADACSPPSCRGTTRVRPCSTAVCPGCMTITACTASPHFSCGTPTTATSFTPG